MLRKHNISELVEEDRLRQLIAVGPELVSELDLDVVHLIGRAQLPGTPVLVE